jgi:UDP-N-acetyl-2-amino-2-deoxyglucuronate dehydrogenase
MQNFALIGAGGFVAPRHLQAIRDTGNRLVSAIDTKDNVGVLDRYFPDVKFFTEIERFDRHLEKLRRGSPDERVNYVSICSPNYLHDAHVRLALRLRAHAICEKPLVVNPWNLDPLIELEAESDCRVYTVLQLRLLPQLIALKQRFESQQNRCRTEVNLSYITQRGPWYHVSWKGDEAKSGGVAVNIGIHFFDLMTWLFGKPLRHELHLSRRDKMAGTVELEWARLRWFLSVDRQDLPAEAAAKGKTAYRSLTIDGEELEFSDGFTDLHTRVYEDILKGGGYGIAEAKPAIELVHAIRTSQVVSHRGQGHPALLDKRLV